MHNPFSRPFEESPELESAAHETFHGLAEESLSEGASASIGSSLLLALANSSRSVFGQSRWAVAGTALVAPMLVLGAASAAAGQSPVDGTLSLVDSAATTLGIGGNSGPVRQDEDRAEQSEDFGQPGSQPGNTANAPGLNGRSKPTATPTPGGETATPSPTEPGATGTPTAAPTEKSDPHANGKGCDDVLFANGEPPFASPGGPVGCDVGNSGERRQNGVNHSGDDGGTPTATRTAGETPTAPATAASSNKPGNGGGNGKAANGNGGNGSQTPAESTPVPSGTASNSKPGQGNSGSDGAKGNSGNAPGKNR